MMFTRSAAALSALLLLVSREATGFAPSSRSLVSSTALRASGTPDVVVISPPGGVGEIASVEAARLGSSVRWFVVSASSGAASAGGVKLTGETLAAVEKAGGSIELAGSDAASLLATSDDDASGAASAVAAWCRGAGSVVCAYDGAEEEQRRVDRARPAEDRGKGEELFAVKSAVRVAAREAAASSAGMGGTMVAILPDGEEVYSEDDEENSGPGFFQGLLGGNKVVVPGNLREALKADGKAGIALLRHGELFGAPESSPDSSPFFGGPRREPQIREMYTTRSVRVDPTVSNTNKGQDGGSKSNRLALGALAARLSTGAVDSRTRAGRTVDVGVSSFAGTDVPTTEEWAAEFTRALDAIGSSSGGAKLFEAEFASVPSVDRLTRWIAEKWAPTVLRSYDLAGTRVGARPVFAMKTEGADSVEIVWKDMVDFQSVDSGRMIVEVSERGLTAKRGPGDAKAGFGKTSSKPLPGEDILVKRLADAASQAVEKGLAVKVAKKKAAKTPPPVVAAPVAVAPPEPEDESGPRTAGAKRSSERSRGTKRRVRKTE